MQVRAVIEDDLDIDAWVEEMIAENGYAQISMHGPDPREPGFAFTIGVQDMRGGPELFCMGVAPDVAAQLFSVCVEAMGDGRLDPGMPDQDVSGLVEGYPLRFRQLPASFVMQTATSAVQRYGAALRMVHLVLPDPDGRFPGDPDCNLHYVAGQDIDRLLTGPQN